MIFFPFAEDQQAGMLDHVKVFGVRGGFSINTKSGRLFDIVIQDLYKYQRKYQLEKRDI